MVELPKLIGQLKDLADYWEPNDLAAATIIRQAVAALSKQPDEAAVERVARALYLHEGRSANDWDVHPEFVGPWKRYIAYAHYCDWLAKARAALQAYTPDSPSEP